MSGLRALPVAAWAAALVAVAMLPGGCRSAARTWSASGSLEGEAVTVRAPRLARLQTIVVEAGDTVYRGDPLASFDATLADAEIEVASARLAVAEARAAVGAAEVGRRAAEGVGAASLPAGGAQGTDMGLDAEFGVAEARSALASQRSERAALDVVAPLDGVVIARYAEPGEVLVQGAALVRIADLERLTLTVFAPARRLGEMEVGDVVEVVVDAYPEEVREGVVESIADQAEFTPRNLQTEEQGGELVFRVRLAVANRDRRLWPGMTATATWRGD